MKIQHVIRLFATTILLIPMYGCTPAAQRQAGYVGNVTDSTNSTDNTDATYYMFRPDLASRLITSISGVHKASVFIYGNNAYVAVDYGSVTPHANTNLIPGRPSGVPSVENRNGDFVGANSGGALGGRLTNAGGFGGGIVFNGNMRSRDKTGSNGNKNTVTPALRQQISTIIKRDDPAITVVHVSDDPDLMMHFQSLQTGAGYTVYDFNKVIKRYFP